MKLDAAAIKGNSSRDDPVNFYVIRARDAHDGIKMTRRDRARPVAPRGSARGTKIEQKEGPRGPRSLLGERAEPSSTYVAVKNGLGKGTPGTTARGRTSNKVIL